MFKLIIFIIKHITIIPIKKAKIASIIVIPPFFINKINKVEVIDNKTPIQSYNLNKIFRAIAVPRTS